MNRDSEEDILNNIIQMDQWVYKNRPERHPFPESTGYPQLTPEDIKHIQKDLFITELMEAAEQHARVISQQHQRILLLEEKLKDHYTIFSLLIEKVDRLSDRVDDFLSVRTPIIPPIPNKGPLAKSITK